MSHESYRPKVKHETTSSNHELVRRSHEVERNRHEKAENTPTNHEKLEHEARRVVEQETQSIKELPATSEKNQQPAIRTNTDRVHSFNATMHHVRRELSKPERTLSKIIHQPIIEKTSEIAGKTIVRPSGIIGGTIAAFIGLLSVYGVARFAGFSLSGSEMPVLLLVGFLVGLFIEWILKIIGSGFGFTKTSLK